MSPESHSSVTDDAIATALPLVASDRKSCKKRRRQSHDVIPTSTAHSRELRQPPGSRSPDKIGVGNDSVISLPDYAT